tara:strand:- start:21252 stop:22094 length:843 start_codon:yes stop_codon:yes gene_type:complete
MKTIELIPKINIKKTLNMRAFSRASKKDFDLKNIFDLKIIFGGKEKKLSEIFNIKIISKSNNSRDRIFILKNTNHFFENIGYNWQDNLLIIYGDVGSFLGAKMNGGTIELNGNCESFTGANMIDGKIQINGNAMDYVGAPLLGETKGMLGGTICIKGNAGDFLANFMRRGLILVEKNVGLNCAKNLIAGTLIIKNTIGNYLGSGMKRGTLILKKPPIKIPDYLIDCGVQELNFFSLFSKFLKNKKFKNSNNILFRKYIGDRNNLGLGEILIQVKNTKKKN